MLTRFLRPINLNVNVNYRIANRQFRSSEYCKFNFKYRTINIYILLICKFVWKLKLQLQLANRVGG